MKKLISVIWILGFFSVQVYGQYNLAKKFEAPQNNNNEPVLPYAKYEFDNGLTVIVNEDHSDPVVTIDFTFRVGSANDYADRTGSVYLINKMMYRENAYTDTKYNLSLLKNYGAWYHSFIDRDKSGLTIQAPGRLLNYILWQQAYNLMDFNNRVDQDALDLAKEELTGEMIDSFGNNPFGLEAITIHRALYSFAYPYSWPVFGTGRQLQSIYPEDLKKFYEEWFGVNNLIITISGDVTTEDVLDAVNNQFGKMPSGLKTYSEFQNQVDMVSLGNEEEFSKDRYITVKLKSTQPTLVLRYRTVPRYHEDAIYLNIFANYLDKEGSFLYETLVAGQLADEIEVLHHAYKQGGEFTIRVVAKEGVSLKTINDTISYLMKANLAPDELENHRNEKKRPERKVKEQTPNQNGMDKQFAYVMQYNSNLIKGLEQSCRKVKMLRDYEFYAADPGFFEQELQASFTINLMTLPKFAAEYLVMRPKLVCSVVTEEDAGLVAGKTNYQFHSLQSIITHVKPEELLKVTPQQGGTPRIKKPSAPPFPDYDKKTLENGFVILSNPDKESDIVNLKFIVTLDQGSAVFNQMAADMLAQILDNQISEYRNGELASLLTTTGGSYSSYSEGNKAILEINISKVNATNLRELFRSLLLESNLMGYNPDGVIMTQVEKYTNPYQLNLNQLLSAGLFDGVIKKTRERSPEETPDFILKERIARVIENASRMVTPNNSMIVLSGNMDGSMVSELSETFMMWSSEGSPKVNNEENKKEKPQNQEKAWMFDNNSVKAGMYFNYLTVDASEKNNIRVARMLNFIISSAGNAHPGGFDLFETVEKHSGDKYYYFIKTRMDADSNLAFAYAHLKKQLDFYRDKKIKCRDFRALKKQYLFNDIVGYDSYSDKNDLIISDFKGTDVAYRGKNFKQVKKIKRKELRNLMRNNPESNYTTLITGQKLLIEKNIPASLKGKAVFIDQNGNKVVEE